MSGEPAPAPQNLARPTDTGHSVTAQVGDIERRIHQNIGAWVVAHWKELLWLAGGLMSGATAASVIVYELLSSQVHDSITASKEAKGAATALTATVGVLQGTVAQLVTQQQLNAALERITKVEDTQHFAHDWKPDPALGKKLPHPHPPMGTTPNR